MNDLIAYCGVDCLACPDYQNKICPSCRKTEWKADDICMPVKCCKEKEIEFCAHCEGFPCEDMAEFYEESESHRNAYMQMCKIRDERRS